MRNYELLRLRLLAAFLGRDLTYGALAELLAKERGHQADASTVWRILNEPEALPKSRSQTLLGLAVVLGVALDAEEGNAVAEAVATYGHEIIGRILQSLGPAGGAERVATLLERLAAMSPPEREALLKLCGEE